MHSWARLALLATLSVGCSGGETPPYLSRDGASLHPDGLPDGTAPRDGLFPPLDGSNADRTCVLGTVDDCGYCGDICLPVEDLPSTVRACVAGSCLIQCDDEQYDVNTDGVDGCEIADDLPIHDVAAEAADLGSVDDCDSATTWSGTLPSDDRKHLRAPVDRPNGRPDWYRLKINDKPGCLVEAEIEISLHALPPASAYKAVAYYRCADDDNELKAAEQLAYGGTTISLDPSTACTLIGDDSGTLYLSIEKQSGPHSAAEYAITVKP